MRSPTARVRSAVAAVREIDEQRARAIDLDRDLRGDARVAAALVAW
jgi:hypothetical protein